MSTAPRRTHQKSRSGCMQCKRRRVKCGEEGNNCKNCVKRGIVCSFTSQRQCSDPTEDDIPIPCSPLRLGFSRFGVTPQDNNEEPPNIHPQTAPLGRCEELCLLHHYVTSTCKGITRNDSEAEVWRDAPMQEGTRYPFMLDGILALAALHLGSEVNSSRERYFAASLHYQISGLRGYQQQLKETNEENCHALFGFSAIINLIAIAMWGGRFGLAPTSAGDTIITIFELSKGIRSILDACSGKLLLGPYKPTFQKDPHCGLHLSEDVASALAAIRRRVREIPEKSHGYFYLDTYTAAVDQLEDAFKQMELHQNFGPVVAWPISIPAVSSKLVEARDPMMLLILVHYGVLYLGLDDIW